VWQNPHPVPMMRALNAVIHKNSTPKEAQELYEELSSKQ